MQQINQIHKTMNKQKQIYLSPETETLVVRFEGVVCQSANGFREGSAGDYSGDIFDNGSY